MKNILVLFEFSGIIRSAFANKGFNAWSCDLQKSERLGNHFEGDYRKVIPSELEWDLVIAHPPCTYLCVSGSQWWWNKKEEQTEAFYFVMNVWRFPCKRMALENPIGILSTNWMKQNQIIQPYHFGSLEQKASCLWLRNLPNLVRTHPDPVFKLESSHELKDRRNRANKRSRTDPYIALAMAEQWGKVL